jgi:hemoglobin-like flavoprotein
MDRKTITLVQESWKSVAALGPIAGALFYDNLFRADPALKPLFKGDIAEQGARLLQMVGIAVACLDDLDKLVPVLRALGVRHAGYGVEDRHYAVVGDTLLKTLDAGLGEAFTAECEVAWTMVYGLIARTMMGAAHAAADKAMQAVA